MRELARVNANEWMKLIRRWRLWIAAVLGLAMVALFAFGTYHSYRTQLRYNSLPAWQQQLAVDKEQLRHLQALQKHPDSYQGPPMKDRIQALQSEIQQLQRQIANQTESHAEWRRSLQKQIRSEQKQMANQQSSGGNMTAEQRAEQEVERRQVQQTLMEQTYRLAHDVRELAPWQQTAYNMVAQFLSFGSPVFLPLLAVILVADMVSGESTSGTIKLLLVRPVPRWKVLLGKWLVGLTATAVLTLGISAVLWLVGCALFGTGGGMQPEMVGVTYTFQTISNPGGATESLSMPVLNHAFVLPAWQYVLWSVLLTTFSMMVVATIAFLCSTLFKSAMASTAVALGAVIIGVILLEVLHNSRWVLALFPTHLNLLSDWTGGLAQQLSTSVSLSTGVWVLTIWGVLALALSVVYFARKDVLNA
jgi:ABC-2 type transport system permease protein